MRESRTLVGTNNDSVARGDGLTDDSETVNNSETEDNEVTNDSATTADAVTDGVLVGRNCDLESTTVVLKSVSITRLDKTGVTCLVTVSTSDKTLSVDTDSTVGVTDGVTTDDKTTGDDNITTDRVSNNVGAIEVNSTLDVDVSVDSEGDNRMVGEEVTAGVETKRDRDCIDVVVSNRSPNRNDEVTLATVTLGASVVNISTNDEDDGMLGLTDGMLGLTDGVLDKATVDNLSALEKKLTS